MLPSETKHSTSLLPTQPMRPREAPDPCRDRLKIPQNLPGAQAAPLEPPAADPSKRAEAIRHLFPDLTPLDADPIPIPGPNNSALTLGDLQRLALSNNPVVRQAAADVEIARNTAIQAGLWPGPTVGFQGDQLNTALPAGHLEFYSTQIFRMAEKQQFANASALIDVLNAELAHRRGRVGADRARRAATSPCWWARENLKVSRAQAEFADEVYPHPGRTAEEAQAQAGL